MKVEFFRHAINNDDIRRVQDVLKSLFLTTGQAVQEFEKALQKHCQSRHAIGLTSCTSGLHLSLLAWDIGPGAEVITTPMTFCATTNAIIQAGAKPVFVDVEEDTGNIRADLIESKITKRTKAIMPVHLYGQMCDMKKIRQVANKYSLAVIEDAAHCLEGQREGIRPGQKSDAACFSFYATKNITSGEGGAVVTNNQTKASLLRQLRLHGIDKSASERYAKRYQHWDMPLLGWKFNMNNIQAALLIGQLERIDALWQKRAGVARHYTQGLYPARNIQLLKTKPQTKHAYHLFTILVPAKARDKTLFGLQKKGIGVAVNYRPVHLLKYYRKSFGYQKGLFPVAEDIGRRTISLPLYPGLKTKEVDYVIKSVLKLSM